MRHLIFYEVKLSYLREVLSRTATTRDPLLIYVNRLDAAKLWGTGQSPDPSHTVFGQMYAQLHHVNPALLRQKERSFKVIFKGEHAEGEGILAVPLSLFLSPLCLSLLF